MKRLIAALSAAVMAAMLLWTPDAAAYDDSAAGSEPPRCWRAIVSIDGFHGRTIEITVGLGGRRAAPPCAAPPCAAPPCGASQGAAVRLPAPQREVAVWQALSDGEDLLWKTAAAIRRRALDRLSDLLLRRKVN